VGCGLRQSREVMKTPFASSLQSPKGAAEARAETLVQRVGGSKRFGCTRVQAQSCALAQLDLSILGCGIVCRGGTNKCLECDGVDLLALLAVAGGFF